MYKWHCMFVPLPVMVIPVGFSPRVLIIQISPSILPSYFLTYETIIQHDKVIPYINNMNLNMLVFIIFYY